MNLPLFVPQDDPGPRFLELLKKSGHNASHRFEALSSAPTSEFKHGTTCVALRYVDGVLLAGDRRATSGHLISHRSIEKVFAADNFSGVAIAGAAGPSAEMVRLFQLQLEHYEKVEGRALSLEGKANQLSQMVRANFPAAMQGLVVVPIFAGYDTQAARGRLFEYDITGGKYEETDHVSTGSGSLHATTVIKLGYKPNLGSSAAINLAIKALYEAADEDSATAGPDLVRGIYPVVATISAKGYQRIGEEDLAKRSKALVASRQGK